MLSIRVEEQNKAENNKYWLVLYFHEIPHKYENVRHPNKQMNCIGLVQFRDRPCPLQKIRLSDFQSVRFYKLSVVRRG
jgi:hypothetical protein